MESNESNVEEAENDEAMGANYEWDEYKVGRCTRV
jgi:hypothetical protein